MSNIAMAIPDPQVVSDTELRRILVAMKASIEYLASTTAASQQTVQAVISKLDIGVPLQIDISDYESVELDTTTLIVKWNIPRNLEYSRMCYFEANARRTGGGTLYESRASLELEVAGNPGLSASGPVIADSTSSTAPGYVYLNAIIPKEMKATLVLTCTAPDLGVGDTCSWDHTLDHFYFQTIGLKEA
jgi:hypothetical protein